MDRKTLLAVLLCVALWIGANYTINHYFPPLPAPAPSTNAPPATLTATNTAGAIPTLAESPAIPAGAPQFLADTNAPEELLVVTNDYARYTFTSRGGGLKTVELFNYPEAVGSRKQKEAGRFATLNADAPTPALAILGGETVQGNGIFQLTPTTNGVIAGKQLANGLTIIKEFHLSSNYLVTATVWLQNQSSQTLSLPAQEWVVGTASPDNPGMLMKTHDNTSQTDGLMWHNGKKTTEIIGSSWFSKSGFACIPRTPPADYRSGAATVAWAAAHNQFFALALMPSETASEVTLRPVKLPWPPTDDPAATTLPLMGYQATLVYPALTLTNNQTVLHRFVLFAGPKEYRTLAKIALEFNNEFDAVMGFGSFWGFFAKALLLGMNKLHALLSLSYGWTIVVITVLIKLIFWPLTAASTRSMKRMQTLAPQIKALQEKHKDDPLKAQKKMMELYKEHKASPVSGCLPVLIQTPVFIGFVSMVRSAIELRGATFLWVADLSQPDTVFIIPGLGFVPLIGIPAGLPINPLPLIMVATMLWQSHVAPQSPGVDPTQQKIMRYMPLMFLVFFYKYSSGMALYWTVNTILSVIQTKLTKTDPVPSPGAAPVPALTSPPKKKK